MRIWNEVLTLETKNKVEVLKLRPRIEAAVQKAGIAEGLVVVSTLHGNTGVCVSLEDEAFQKDVLAWLEKLAPEGEGYNLAKHESNAGAYLKGLLLGQQACLSLEGGRLALGPFQEVYYVDFDGQRPKRVLVKILGE